MIEPAFRRRQWEVVSGFGIFMDERDGEDLAQKRKGTEDGFGIGRMLRES